MSKLSQILDRLPQYYDKSDTSYVHGLIEAFAEELEITLSQIERADGMIGIDTTLDEDLEYRWGNMLNLPRIKDETELQYRSRLKNSIVTLSGGTERAIKYAVAVGLGINNDQKKMDKMIKVYDAWDYTKPDVPDEDKVPCHFVCEIDLDNQPYSHEMELIMIECTNENKAAGTQPHFIVSNYRINRYVDLEPIPYVRLEAIKYNQLGAEV